ncbi:MAG: T9SS type A sorting domain-containing protein [Candidatus Fermentibacteria bacterium]
MRITHHSILFCLILLGSSLQALPVELDPTFDGDGIAVFSPGTIHDVARDIVVLPDTTTIICGTAQLNGATAGIIMRILEDGTQDMSFATGGLAELQYGTNTYAYNLELLPDGKLLVSGICYTTASDAEFFVARFLTDGTPDTSFGTGGHALTDYSATEDLCYAMGLQSDGKIVLAGRTNDVPFSALLFTRFNADGTLDTSFGTDGYTMIDASTQDESINTLGFLDDGTIVGFGNGYQSTPYFGHLVCMAKLDSAGIPVSGFGTGGVRVPPVFNDISTVYDLQVENDTLFVTGTMYDTVNDDVIFVAKMDSDGDTIVSFGTGGITFTKPNPDDHIHVGYDLLLDEGNIYVCGTTGYAPMFNPRDFILLRYTPAGILDPEFNTTGYIITSIGPLFDEANALVIQPDGKVVLAGFAQMGADNDLILARYLIDMTSIGEHFSAPGELYLQHIAPNPFGSSVTITFSIQFPESVTLEIFDVSGRLIETLVDEDRTAGTHAVVFYGEEFSSGIYFCRLQVGDEHIQTEMMTLLR